VLFPKTGILLPGVTIFTLNRCLTDFFEKNLFWLSKTGKNGEKHITENKNIFFLLSKIKFHHHPFGKKPKGIKFGSFSKKMF